MYSHMSYTLMPLPDAFIQTELTIEEHKQLVTEPTIFIVNNVRVIRKLLNWGFQTGIRGPQGGCKEVQEGLWKC